MKKILPVLLLVMVVSCAAPGHSQPSAATAQPAGGTPTATLPSVDPADAFAYEQNRRLGRGLNLGNALEAPKEGEWGMTLEEGFFSIIRQGGFQSVRVPISWSSHAAQESPYTIEKDFLARIDWVIAQAEKNDLVVILDMHHYQEMMDTPQGQTTRFLAIWEQIAEHFQKAPDSVYFELLNEPNAALNVGSNWNTALAETIALIRQTNPRRTIVLGPQNWNNISGLGYLKLPKEDRNLIVTIHYYEPFHFTHQGAEWVDGSDSWLRTTWEAKSSQKNVILRDLDSAARWGETNQRPIFLGEFGVYSKADMDSRALWTEFIARAAETRGMSWAYWEFGAGFGAYDREKKQWVEPIYRALIPQ